MAKNNVQSVSYLFPTQVIKPQGWKIATRVLIFISKAPNEEFLILTQVMFFLHHTSSVKSARNPGNKLKLILEIPDSSICQDSYCASPTCTGMKILDCWSHFLGPKSDFRIFWHHQVLHLVWKIHCHQKWQVCQADQGIPNLTCQSILQNRLPVDVWTKYSQQTLGRHVNQFFTTDSQRSSESILHNKLPVDTRINV